MKQSDVVIGNAYLTRVSGELVEVLVESSVQRFQGLFGPSARQGRVVRRYQLRRVDNGTMLPKLRPASALREKPTLTQEPHP